jgi:hypothetical protein
VVQSTLPAALMHVHDPASGLGWLSLVARREGAARDPAGTALRCRRRAGVLAPAGLAAGGPEEIVLFGRVAGRAPTHCLAAPTPASGRAQAAHPFDRAKYATISAELQIPVGSMGPTHRRGLERMRRLLAADPEWNAEAWAS